MASTLWLILSLPLAHAASLVRIERFFPAMLLVIGGRYLVFSLLFGLRIFWTCGLVLAGAAYFLGRFHVSPSLSVFSGAAIEAAFAVAIFVMHHHEGRPDNSFKPNPLRGSA